MKGQETRVEDGFVDNPDADKQDRVGQYFPRETHITLFHRGGSSSLNTDGGYFFYERDDEVSIRQRERYLAETALGTRRGVGMKA
mgnify:CR=1 FL=1